MRVIAAAIVFHVAAADVAAAVSAIVAVATFAGQVARHFGNVMWQCS